MLKDYKREIVLISFGVGLYFVLMNFSMVTGFLNNVLHIFMTVIMGFIIAFILNVPMKGIEKLTVRITRGKFTRLSMKRRRLVTLILTLLIVAAVLAFVIVLLIPDLTSSCKSLYLLIVDKWPEIIALLKTYHIDVEWISGFMESLDMEKFVTSTFDVATSAVSGVIEFSIAFIIALYVLMSKDELYENANKFIKAFMKGVWAAKVRNIASLTNYTFSKFLSGQCLEACILGSLIFITLSIARVPYADLIGVLTTICAFVPYIGAFMSFTIGCLLVAIVDPGKLVLCAAIYLIVQFIEGHFIYPYVVGNSVGMKPLWTLIAVIVGGNLLGLFGMIFFIPLMAVIVTLLNDYTERRIKRKENFDRDVKIYRKS